MKSLFFIAFLLMAISCNNSEDFYLGTWDLNERNGVSTFTFNENNTMIWSLNGLPFIENEKFIVNRLSPGKISIKSGEGKDCTKIIMVKLSENQCIFYNHKCWINENMVDEVALARKNKAPKEQVSVPAKEIITLPKNFTGGFFIVYNHSENKQSTEIKINGKGIGINEGEPDFRQLFNANRIFRVEGREGNVTIANPHDYHHYLSTEIDSLYRDEEVIIIQQGFNQSGRKDWNKKHTEKVNDNLNIEYFEIRWLKN